MSEGSLWEYLREGMRGRWDACRHEDAVTPGVPDVSYGVNGIQGWIELKALKDWPKKEDTAVPLNHLTKFQKLWLKRRGESGAACWILLRVNRDYLLFSWQVLDELGEANQFRLKNIASAKYTGKIDWDDFEKHVCVKR